MFCLVTDLMDCEDYPGPELAALYRRRWDESETMLREAKAPLRGAGPGTGPMLRSGSPALVWQELAAWAVGTEMARGVVLGVALAAVPARKGRRAGHAVRPRDLSFARALRTILSAVRLGHDSYQAVTSEIAKFRNVVDHDRHRARKSKSPSSFPHAGAEDTVTRIAPAVITMANTSALPGKSTPTRLSGNPPDPWTRPPRRDTLPSSMRAERKLPTVTKSRNYRRPAKQLKPMALGRAAATNTGLITGSKQADGSR